MHLSLSVAFADSLYGSFVSLSHCSSLDMIFLYIFSLHKTDNVIEPTFANDLKQCILNAIIFANDPRKYGTPWNNSILCSQLRFSEVLSLRRVYLAFFLMLKTHYVTLCLPFNATPYNSQLHFRQYKCNYFNNQITSCQDLL